MKRACIAGIAIALAACGADLVQQEGPPPLFKYSSMKDAISSAQETLPVFWATFNGADANLSGFRLLVQTPSARHTVDYVWVETITQLETGYRGVVPSEHETADGFKPGDTIDFRESDIADWRYKDGDRLRGAYTTRAMLDLVPNADIDNLRGLLHDDPIAIEIEG